MDLNPLIPFLEKVAFEDTDLKESSEKIKKEIESFIKDKNIEIFHGSPIEEKKATVIKTWWDVLRERRNK
jgi:hypothetical protein